MQTNKYGMNSRAAER